MYTRTQLAVFGEMHMLSTDTMIGIWNRLGEIMSPEEGTISGSKLEAVLGDKGLAHVFQNDFRSVNPAGLNQITHLIDEYRRQNP